MGAVEKCSSFSKQRVDAHPKRPQLRQLPQASQRARVIVGEISRITDHLTCLGMAATELGAMSVGFYMLEAREMLYDLVEAITGARLTVTYCRLGGVIKDLPADFADGVKNAFTHGRRILDDCDRLLSRNRIFLDRLVGVGVLPKADVVSYGLTGPLLRASVSAAQSIPPVPNVGVGSAVEKKS